MAFLFLIQYFSHGASLLRPDPVFLDDLADLGVGLPHFLQKCVGGDAVSAVPQNDQLLHAV